MKKIAIIGAGFTGTTLALNLVRFSHKPMEIILIERRGSFGLGDAYSTPYEFHLLNVRASSMSAFDDDPHHFLNWLKAHPELLAKLPDTTPLADQFVPRVFYGNYLKELLQKAMEKADTSVKITLIADEALAAVQDENQVRLTFKNSASIQADLVVLALGNNPTSPFPFPISEHVQVIQNPWEFTAPTKIKSNQAVLIIGTGLSMIDAVLTLHHQQHRGPIYALSRRGLIPLPHAKQKTDHKINREEIPSTLRDTMRFMRARATTHSEGGGDWRAVIDAFRDYTVNAWANASLTEKKQFLRHILPIWNIHRHRVHIEIADLLDQLMQQGQLHLLSGRVLRVENQKAHIKLKNEKEIKQIQIDWLINCMGPQLSMKQQPPLIQSLQQQGLAQFDPLQLGLMTDAHGALQINSGEYSKMFYTLGALTKGMHWEITSVPDIRKQCLALALYLLES